MELIEVRDLDGPNLFALRPVIKLEVRIDDDESVPTGARAIARDLFGVDLAPSPLGALLDAVGCLHVSAGLPVPEAGSRPLDTPGHQVVFYDWTDRETALCIA